MQHTANTKYFPVGQAIFQTGKESLRNICLSTNEKEKIINVGDVHKPSKRVLDKNYRRVHGDNNAWCTSSGDSFI